MSDPASLHEKQLDTSEQELLDTALQESDQLLARSLQDDQRRRARKIWLSVFVVGVIAMSVLILAFLFGAFAFSVPDVAEAKGKQPSTDEIERAEALAAEGWDLWKKQKLVDAVKKFEESVELDPSEADSWNGLGWALFNSGQRKRALPAFERCVELVPSHPAGLNGLGQLYFSRGEYTKAEKYLKQSAKNPYASASWWGLAKVYLLTNEFEKALPWAEKIVAESPQEQVAKQMLAAAKAEKLTDELRKAIEPFGIKTLEVDVEDSQESNQLPGISDEQWRQRLLSTKQSDRWSVGAEIGMDLVRLPGDRPFKILKTNWKKIPSSVRKQILKGFTPGMMGNKEMHPYFYDVMHLGMTDPNSGVRQFAAGYIEMQGHPNFEKNAKGYRRWRKQREESKSKKDDTKSKGAPAKIIDKQWHERLLATKESDPWNVGAEIGMELVRIPGDLPFQILEADWKNIPASVRKQILKGFTPGMMGNKDIHPRFFDVMHLGMSDPDAGVREFAAGYIKMQGLPNFEKNIKGYQRWKKRIEGRTAQEIVDGVKSK